MDPLADGAWLLIVLGLRSSYAAITEGGDAMGKVIASITTSVDGYVTGPDDGPADDAGAAS